MADSAVTFILDQLSIFIREESALLGGLKNEVQQLKDELGQMTDLIRSTEAMVENKSNIEAWVIQVRDVAYDAEDVLDEFFLRFGRHYGHGFLGRVRKGYSSIENLKARHRIAIKIHTIRDRAINIYNAREIYQVPNGSSEQGPFSALTPDNSYDSRSDALFLEEADLVDILRRKKKLMDMLFTSDSQLRVISVVGMGGLGKTALVKKVYDDAAVKTKFKRRAWITFSESFKIETLLKQAIRQLFRKSNHELDTMDIVSLKQYVRDHLHQEKYIIVFDDIWQRDHWNDIRMAFPNDNCNSRIIITTRKIDVGQAATTDIGGDIYPLERLTEEESRILFCKKAFRATSFPHRLEEISKKILYGCAGLALAIVVIGGALATKSDKTEEWNLFCKSLDAELRRNKELDRVAKILLLSYYDLSDRLRICFLYLSILPEDVSIKKKKLIQLWVAEGFVEKENGRTLEESAELYLNELINRSLVQVAETTVDGQLKACRIHDMMQKIVLRKASDQNITTIYDEPGKQIPDKVRRMVIHCFIDNTQVSDDWPKLKYLRTFVLCEPTGSMSKQFLYNLLSDGVRLIKVLDLQGAPLESIPNEIFKLLHLKYLCLRHTNVKTVPKSIRKLKKLETLDLRDTSVTKLPIGILKLQKLRHLLVSKIPIGFLAPYKIGNLQSLQSLSHIDADQMGNIKIVNEIGKLTQLRKLGITKLTREDGKELCSSLEKLTNLRSLYVFSIKEEEVIDLQYSLSSTPQFLRKLILNGRLEKPPQWIASLHGLARIKLVQSRLRDDPLNLLQGLPNLVELELGQAYEGKGLRFKARGFQGLKILAMWKLQQLRWVRVEKGAMPFLEKLVMKDCKLMEELPAGIEHLRSLQYLEFVAMSDTFVKIVEDMDKRSTDYKKIAHIPQVIISLVEWKKDGHQRERRRQ